MSRRLRALGVVAAVLSALLLSTGLIAAPASAATTTTAQLSLTGVVVDSHHPAGGSEVGIYPGGTVKFTSSPVPTAGLDALGLNGLVDTLNGVLGSVANLQIKVTFGANFPGGAKTVTLGSSASCDGAVTSTSFTFPKVGTYSFVWSAQKVSLLSGVLGAVTQKCQTDTLNLNADGNQLQKAGVALNAKNQYVGNVVVATTPPSTGIGIQIPSVGASPSVSGLPGLPSIGISGTTVNVPVPSVGNIIPGLSGSSSAKPSTAHSASPSYGYSRMPAPIAASVIPDGYGCCVVAQDGSGVSAQNASANGVAGGGSGVVPSGSAHASGAAADGSTGSSSNGPVDLAAGRTSSAGLPVVLAILAVVALSLVTVMYTRLFLTRRS